jgi:hypothetical protein
MSNGRAWTSSDTQTLERMQGRPDREIAQATGQPMRQVQEHRRALGIKAAIPRAGWSRRDYLMASAAGLDIRM